MQVIIDGVIVNVTKNEDDSFEVWTPDYNEDDKETIILSEWTKVSNRYTDDVEVLNDYGEVMFVSNNMTDEEIAANIFFVKEGL